MPIIPARLRFMTVPRLLLSPFFTGSACPYNRPAMKVECFRVAAFQFLSTDATNNMNAEKSNNSRKGEKSEKKEKDDGNIFFDNIGKIFLSAIGVIILGLVRSSYGASNREKIREQIEDDASLDPLEIDDLRVANSELNPDIFRYILKEVSKDFPEGVSTYEDFVHTVRSTMKSLKGDAFTVELGHLLDRVVDFALTRHGKSRDDQVSTIFYLTALSLALDIDTSVSERIRLLFEVVGQQQGNVAYEDVEQLVGYLQDTCQLATDTQVIKAENYIPIQEYKRGSPSELIAWDGNRDTVMDLQSFNEILRSKSVCAWGECYFKKKPPI